MLLYNYEGFSVNQTDNSGATPLIWSIFCGSEISLTYLLAQPGIHVNAQNDKGQTALHISIVSYNCRRPANMIKRLLVKGADLSIKDNKGRTAMDLCIKKAADGKKDILDALRVLERANHKSKTCS